MGNVEFKKDELDALEEKAKEIVVTATTGDLLVLELYSLLDDKEYRKMCVKGMLERLYKDKKISNAVYEKALNILEN